MPVPSAPAQRRASIALARAAAVAVVALVGACGETPTAQCKDAVAATCSRVFACYSADQKASASFVSEFGASETDCQAKLGAASCSGFVADDGSCALAGGSSGMRSGTWSAKAADACVADLRAATCDAITSRSFSSSNCAAACVAKSS